MKKALFSLVILFVSMFCAVTVYANDYTVSPYRDMIDNYDEAYKAMYEAVADGDDYVDLTQYKITTDDIIKSTETCTRPRRSFSTSISR